MEGWGNATYCAPGLCKEMLKSPTLRTLQALAPTGDPCGHIGMRRYALRRTWARRGSSGGVAELLPNRPSSKAEHVGAHRCSSLPRLATGLPPVLKLALPRCADGCNMPE